MKYRELWLSCFVSVSPGACPGEDEALTRFPKGTRVKGNCQLLQLVTEVAAAGGKAVAWPLHSIKCF